MATAAATSYPRSKIKILLLEGISDSAVAELRAGGYSEIERINGAMSEAEARTLVDAAMKRSEEGTYFGATNFYSFVAMRPSTR